MNLTPQPLDPIQVGLTGPPAHCHSCGDSVGEPVSCGVFVEIDDFFRLFTVLQYSMALGILVYCFGGILVYCFGGNDVYAWVEINNFGMLFHSLAT